CGCCGFCLPSGGLLQQGTELRSLFRQWGVGFQPPQEETRRTGELDELRRRIVADGKCRRKVLTGGRTERFRHAVDIPFRVPLALFDDPSKPGHVLFVARAGTGGEPQRVVGGEHSPPPGRSTRAASRRAATASAWVPRNMEL